MSQTRLSLALDKGLLTLPDAGPVGFWNAPADFHPPVETAVLSQAFAPGFNQLTDAGYDVTPLPDHEVTASIVFCHRAKEATLDLIARAMKLTQPGGKILVEGNKTDGIDSIIKSLKTIAPNVETFAKSHGKLAWFENSAKPPEDWTSDWRQIDEGFVTWPGIFSSDGADAGSALLAATLPPLSGDIADFGAGWGYLSQKALQSSPKVTSATLIEADFHAAEAARRNVCDPRADVIWGDIHRLQGRFDAILCNPPFHTSRKPDPAIGRAFLATAAQRLTPKGQLFVVANRTLPYEATLQERFKSVEALASQGGFKVLHAKYPVLAKQSRSRPHSRVT